MTKVEKLDRYNAERYNELLANMSAAKEQWQAEDGDAPEDDTDHLLSQAIDFALEQGRGWSAGEKEDYLKKILDDDFIPPLFAANNEEVERSGLQEAFTSLIYDDKSPTALYIQFKQRGADAFTNGKRNTVQNLQYYRDAVNHYYEALAWADKITPLQDGDYAQADITDEPTYNTDELARLRSNLCSNIALCHLQLKNWGHVRAACQRALDYWPHNVKAWYRLAKAHQELQAFEEAGNAIESGLQLEADNKELLKLHTQLDGRVRKARQLRQQRERQRAERMAAVKAVWKHCRDRHIRLARTPLVATVTDDEDDHGGDAAESRWHFHLPHSGVLPKQQQGEWSWPCLFLYPSHQQSDFVKDFGESEMLAIRLAQMFPELEDTSAQATGMPWDHNNEFVCSNLAVYFEVHQDAQLPVPHPESVQLLPDQAAAMKFYEASRALQGDEGSDMADVVRALERKRLHQQRQRWNAQHGSLWANVSANPVVRLHPALTLREMLTDARLLVPNFCVTLLVFPDAHPAHTAYLQEHKCVGVLHPKSVEEQQ